MHSELRKQQSGSNAGQVRGELQNDSRANQPRGGAQHERKAESSNITTAEQRIGTGDARDDVLVDRLDDDLLLLGRGADSVALVHGTGEGAAGSRHGGDLGRLDLLRLSVLLVHDVDERPGRVRGLTGRNGVPERASTRVR
jgi:hypothetical protein